MNADFRTPLSTITFPFSVQHQDNLLTLGSCFSEHLGHKLQEGKFSIQINPFGILYNPISLAHAIKRITDQTPYLEKDLFQHHGLWHSFDHHGHFSAPKQSAVLEKIHQHLDQARKRLGQTNRLFITFGTAHVFWHREQQRVVANCHKLPSQSFERRRLTVTDITRALQPLFSQLRENNPSLEIILTVSPVRHLRDGFIENQRSKAVLLLATEQLSTSFSFVHYYPAYELLLDDLRDYRFYAKDMIHPSTLAIDYIWSHFQSCFFAENTQRLLARVEKINKAAAHRPFRPEEEVHQAFLRQQLASIQALQSDFPFLDFTQEERSFSKQLVS